jgi:hypothetical protein
MVTETAWCSTNLTSRQMKKNRIPRNNATQLQSSDVLQKCKKQPLEKRQTFQQMMLGNLEFYMWNIISACTKIHLEI